MACPRVVLLLAEPEDGEAALVQEQVRARGMATARVDTADFPQDLTVAATTGHEGWKGRITTLEGPIALDEVAAVFYRQPRPFRFPPGMSPAEERFARVEARFGLGGLLASLPVRWVPGTPGRVAGAEYKPLQLATAARAGLPIPSTLLTNDPEQARSFADGVARGAVYKALMHKLVTDASQVRLIYTHPVSSTDIDHRAASTTHQFQANLADEKICDVRIVSTPHGAVGVDICTDDASAHQDFRTGYDHLTYQRTEVPGHIAEGCRRYLQALDLRMGVFDFCRTHEGWYFLECGPGAQWAWLHAHAPLAELIAEEFCPW